MINWTIITNHKFISPKFTDDSYLRTDVKPPKLGKGATKKIKMSYKHVNLITRYF